MVLRIRISEKWLHINRDDVCFYHNIKSVIILNEKIIAQLETGDLYAVDKKGNIIEEIDKPLKSSDFVGQFIAEVNQNNLYLKNYTVYFENNIESFVLLDDKIIVQLKIPAGCDEIDNIYAVSMKGDIIWRVQNKAIGCPEYKFISPYVCVNYIDDEIIANDFNGFRFVISPDDGSIVRKINDLKPW